MARIKIQLTPTTHTYKEVPDEIIHIKTTGMGVGDSLCGLTTILPLSKEYNVVYHCPKDNHDFVKLFYWNIADQDYDCDDINKGYTYECITKAKRTRIQRLSQSVGVTPEKPKLLEHQRLKELGVKYKDYVVLAIGSNYDSRRYSTFAYLELEKLLLKNNYKVLILDKDLERVRQFKSDKLVKGDAEQIASLMLNCLCVLGTDSGMMWMGAMCEAKCFCLTGPSTVKGVFDFYTNVQQISSNFSCTGCWWTKPYNDICLTGCASLWSIKPEDILQILDKWYLPQLATNTLSGINELIGIRNTLLETKGLSGVNIEIGVLHGGTAKLISFLDDTELHLYDTFTSQPEDDEDGIHKKGEFKCNIKDVKKNLEDRNVVFHKGVFPETFEPMKIKFCHFDADTYQAAKACLEIMPKHMVKGGKLIMADVGWWATPGVFRAIHESRLPYNKIGEYLCTIQF